VSAARRRLAADVGVLPTFAGVQQGRGVRSAFCVRGPRLQNDADGDALQEEQKHGKSGNPQQSFILDAEARTSPLTK